MITFKISALAEPSELGKANHLQLAVSVLQQPAGNAAAESLLNIRDFASSRVDLIRRKKSCQNKKPLATASFQIKAKPLNAKTAD